MTKRSWHRTVLPKSTHLLLPGHPDALAVTPGSPHRGGLPVGVHVVCLSSAVQFVWSQRPGQESRKRRNQTGSVPLTVMLK